MSLREEREAAKKAAREVELPPELMALKENFGDWLNVKVGEKGPYLTWSDELCGYPAFLALASELRSLEEQCLVGKKDLFRNVTVTCGLYQKTAYVSFFVKGTEVDNERPKRGPSPNRGR